MRRQHAQGFSKSQRVSVERTCDRSLASWPLRFPMRIRLKTIPVRPFEACPVRRSVARFVLILCPGFIGGGVVVRLGHFIGGKRRGTQIVKEQYCTVPAMRQFMRCRSTRPQTCGRICFLVDVRCRAPAHLEVQSRGRRVCSSASVDRPVLILGSQGLGVHQGVDRISAYRHVVRCWRVPAGPRSPMP